MENITTYQEIEFTKEEREELIRLMVGMCFVNTNIELDMGAFAKSNRLDLRGADPYQLKNECGSCACAAGFAAMFCKLKPWLTDRWAIYLQKLFGMHNLRCIEDFLFDPEWPDDIEQAYARMYIVLTLGVPVGFTPEESVYQIDSLEVKVQDLGRVHGIESADVADLVPCAE